MATNFPTSVDNFTNPTANDSLNLPSHSTQHANANDAIEAIETYVLDNKTGLQLITNNVIATNALLVANVFSSKFTHYRVLLNVYGASNGNVVRLTMNTAGGTERTSGYYSAEIGYDYASATTTWYATGSTASWQIGYIGNGSSYKTLYSLDIANPFASDVTTGNGVYSGLNSGAYFKGGITNMASANAESYTGFYIRNSSNTTLTGDYSVYGYTK